MTKIRAILRAGKTKALAIVLSFAVVLGTCNIVPAPRVYAAALGQNVTQSVFDFVQFCFLTYNSYYLPGDYTDMSAFYSASAGKEATALMLERIRWVYSRNAAAGARKLIDYADTTDTIYQLWLDAGKQLDWTDYPEEYDALRITMSSICKTMYDYVYNSGGMSLADLMDTDGVYVGTVTTAVSGLTYTNVALYYGYTDYSDTSLLSTSNLMLSASDYAASGYGDLYNGRASYLVSGALVDYQNYGNKILLYTDSAYASRFYVTMVNTNNGVRLVYYASNQSDISDYAAIQYLRRFSVAGYDSASADTYTNNGTYTAPKGYVVGTMYLRDDTIIQSRLYSMLGTVGGERTVMPWGSAVHPGSAPVWSDFGAFDASAAVGTYAYDLGVLNDVVAGLQSVDTALGVDTSTITVEFDDGDGGDTAPGVDLSGVEGRLDDLIDGGDYSDISGAAGDLDSALDAEESAADDFFGLVDPDMSPLEDTEITRDDAVLFATEQIGQYYDRVAGRFVIPIVTTLTLGVAAFLLGF